MYNHINHTYLSLYVSLLVCIKCKYTYVRIYAYQLAGSGQVICRLSVAACTGCRPPAGTIFILYYLRKIYYITQSKRYLCVLFTSICINTVYLAIYAQIGPSLVVWCFWKLGIHQNFRFNHRKHDQPSNLRIHIFRQASYPYMAGSIPSHSMVSHMAHYIPCYMIWYITHN